MTVVSEARHLFLSGALLVREAWHEDALELTGEAGGATWYARFVWRGEVGGWWRGRGDEAERPHPWALRAEVAESNVDRDLLGRFVSALSGRMLGRVPRSRRHFPDEHRELLAWADALAKRLTRPFHPEAIHAAHGFPRGLRARLARRFTDDESGRLRQLVDCPGLVLLWSALEASPDAAERALAVDFARKVVDGERRDEILGGTLEGLLAHRASGLATGVDSALLGAYRWRAAQPVDLAESRWTLFVRRAGATVEPALLLRPPPVAYVPEDIPRERVANARWYANMAMHDAAVSPTAAGGVEVARAYGRLLSYVSAHETTGRFARGEVLEWLRAAPHRPFRHWTPTVLYRRIRFPPRRAAATVKQPAMAAGRLGPFPPPPLPTLRTRGDRLEPLTTPYSLEREGDAMNHCVGGYVGSVFGRRSYVYAGAVAGQRLTVEVVPHGGGWALRQARGERNQFPSAEAMRRLAEWCAPLPEEDDLFDFL